MPDENISAVGDRNSMGLKSERDCNPKRMIRLDSNDTADGGVNLRDLSDTESLARHDSQSLPETNVNETTAVAEQKHQSSCFLMQEGGENDLLD